MEVYILGDFSISRGKTVNEVLGQLNGKKYLIEGNHDKFLDDKEFDRSLFRWIRPYAEIRDCRRQVILSHYPVFCYKGQYRMTPEGTPLTYMHAVKAANVTLTAEETAELEKVADRLELNVIRFWEKEMK